MIWMKVKLYINYYQKNDYDIGKFLYICIFTLYFDKKEIIFFNFKIIKVYNL